MLSTKKLDDRKFSEILEAAMNRLPALCPTWTDYNAHDPGVTIMELFAWYEEMQRYHLDKMTDAVRRQLLALVNAKPKSAKAAHCLVDISAISGTWPEGTALRTNEGIMFELDETVSVGQAKIKKVYLEDKMKRTDITELVIRSETEIQPFNYGGEKTELKIELANVDENTLRLWVNVCQIAGSVRNPFEDENQMPRIIEWYWNGELITPERDETHALSVSGFINLPVSPCENGELKAVLTDPGCEEIVKISALKCGMGLAKQQRTLRRLFTRRVTPAKNTVIDICFAPAIDGALILFVRTKDGWTQTFQTSDEFVETGRRLTVDTSDAVKDGNDNVMIVCRSSDDIQSTFYSSAGLPNQEIDLILDGEKPVGNIQLICDSLDLDGEVRPMIWNQVQDLTICGSRDRVFVYDEVRERLVFGDGLHGAIVPAGTDSILIASLKVSLCSIGNIPGGTELKMMNDNTVFKSTPAYGGHEAETTEEAAIRFMRDFPDTRKCATVADYERIAMETPGLRIAMVKALPGYDPNEPSGNVQIPMVNVVVLPYSQSPLTMPDERFISAVKRQLEKYRPICTEVNILKPRYVEVGIQLRIRGDKTLSRNDVKNALTAWFGSRQIGQTVVKNEMMLYLQKLPGVWKIERLEFETGFAGSARNGLGDVVLTPDGIAYPGKCDIKII